MATPAKTAPEQSKWTSLRDFVAQDVKFGHTREEALRKAVGRLTDLGVDVERTDRRVIEEMFDVDVDEIKQRLPGWVYAKLPVDMSVLRPGMENIAAGLGALTKRAPKKPKKPTEYSPQQKRMLKVAGGSIDRTFIDDYDSMEQFLSDKERSPSRPLTLEGQVIQWREFNKVPRDKAMLRVQRLLGKSKAEMAEMTEDDYKVPMRKVAAQYLQRSAELAKRAPKKEPTTRPTGTYTPGAVTAGGALRAQGGPGFALASDLAAKAGRGIAGAVGGVAGAAAAIPEGVGEIVGLDIKVAKARLENDRRARKARKAGRGKFKPVDVAMKGTLFGDAFDVFGVADILEPESTPQSHILPLPERFELEMRVAGAKGQFGPGVMKVFDEYENNIEERLGMAGYEAARSDVAEVQEALLGLAASLGGLTRSGRADKDFLDAFSKDFKASNHMWTNMITGGFGATGASIKMLATGKGLGMIKARPVSTALIFAPFAKGVGRLAKSGNRGAMAIAKKFNLNKVVSTLDKIEQATEAVTTKPEGSAFNVFRGGSERFRWKGAEGQPLPTSKPVAYSVEAAQRMLHSVKQAGVGLVSLSGLTPDAVAAAVGVLVPEVSKFLWGEISPGRRAAIQRWLISTSINKNKNLGQIIEQIADDPAIARAEIESLGSEMAVRTKKGQVEMAEVVEGEPTAPPRRGPPPEAGPEPPTESRIEVARSVYPEEFAQRWVDDLKKADAGDEAASARVAELEDGLISEGSEGKRAVDRMARATVEEGQTVTGVADKISRGEKLTPMEEQYRRNNAQAVEAALEEVRQAPPRGEPREPPGPPEVPERVQALEAAEWWLKEAERSGEGIEAAQAAVGEAKANLRTPMEQRGPVAELQAALEKLEETNSRWFEATERWEDAVDRKDPFAGGFRKKADNLKNELDAQSREVARLEDAAGIPERDWQVPHGDELIAIEGPAARAAPEPVVETPPEVPNELLDAYRKHDKLYDELMEVTKAASKARAKPGLAVFKDPILKALHEKWGAISDEIAHQDRVIAGIEKTIELPEKFRQADPDAGPPIFIRSAPEPAAKPAAKPAAPERVDIYGDPLPPEPPAGRSAEAVAAAAKLAPPTARMAARDLKALYDAYNNKGEGWSKKQLRAAKAKLTKLSRKVDPNAPEASYVDVLGTRMGHKNPIKILKEREGASKRDTPRKELAAAERLKGEVGAEYSKALDALDEARARNDQFLEGYQKRARRLHDQERALDSEIFGEGGLQEAVHGPPSRSWMATYAPERLAALEAAKAAPEPVVEPVVEPAPPKKPSKFEVVEEDPFGEWSVEDPAAAKAELRAAREGLEATERHQGELRGHSEKAREEWVRAVEEGKRDTPEGVRASHDLASADYTEIVNDYQGLKRAALEGSEKARIDALLGEYTTVLDQFMRGKADLATLKSARKKFHNATESLPDVAGKQKFGAGDPFEMAEPGAAEPHFSGIPVRQRPPPTAPGVEPTPRPDPVVTELLPEGLVDVVVISDDGHYDVLAGRAGKRAARDVPVETTSPEFNSAIEEVHKAITDLKVEGLPTRSLARTKAVLTDALRDTGLYIMHDPKVLKSVIAHVVSKLNLSAKAKRAILKDKGFRDQIRKYVRHSLQKGRSQTATFKVAGSDVHISLDNAVAAVVKSMTKKQLRKAQAKAISVVTQNLAQNAYTSRMVGALEGQWRRFGKDREKYVAEKEKGGMTTEEAGLAWEADYSGDVVRNMLDGEHPAMLQIDAQAIRNTIALRGRGAPSIKQSAIDKYTPEGATFAEQTVVVEGLQKVAKALEEDFTPVSKKGKLDMYLRELYKEGGTAEKIFGRENLSESLEKGSVQKGFGSTLRANLWVESTMNENAALLWKIDRTARAHVLSWNFPTHVRNKIQNIVYSGLMFGETPVEVIAHSAKATKQWFDYKAGKLKAGRELDKMRALGRTELMQTTMIESEVGVAGTRDIFNLKEHAPGVAKVLKMPDEAYAFGDSSDKINVASRMFDVVERSVSDLVDGDYLMLAVGAGKRVRLQKKGFGLFLKGRKLNRQQLDTIIARAASKVAQDMFFNYRQVSMLNEVVRRMPILSTGSSFYTWFFKAMDFPGKKGLGSRLVDFTGMPWMETNNAAINARIGRSALGVSARRSAIIQGLQSDMNPDKERIRRMLSFFPRGEGLSLVRTTNEPGIIDVMGLTGYSWSEPTDTVFRGGLRMLAPALAAMNADDETLLADDEASAQETLKDPSKELPKEVRDRIKQRRKFYDKVDNNEIFIPADAAKIVGQGGGLLYNTVHTLLNTREAPTEQRIGSIARSLAKMFIGGTPATAVEMAILGVESPLAKYTGRQWAYMDWQKEMPPKVDKLIDYMAYRMSGVGWREAAVANKLGSYKHRTEKSWNKGINENAKRLNKVIDNQIKQHKKERGEKWVKAKKAEKVRNKALAKLLTDRRKRIMKRADDDAKEFKDSSRRRRTPPTTTTLSIPPPQ